MNTKSTSFSSPQFLPEVGENVLLAMDGSTPRIFPERLAVNSVGVAALQFDVISRDPVLRRHDRVR